MKIICFVIAILSIFIAEAQNPTDVIKIKEPNEKYLEHLIKTKIDSLRNTLKFHALINDSALYIVARSHANYLTENNKAGHTQMNEATKTPSLRLQHFNVKGYLNFEMVSSIYVHRPIKIKPNPNEKETIAKTFKTYNEVADYVVNDWALDNDTKEELMNERYNVIGLSVIINQLNDCIKIVGFLGRPYLKFAFTESKTLFPYSQYQPKEGIKSFEEAATSTVITRPFKLIEGTESKCAKCKEPLKDIKFKVTNSNGKTFLTAEGIKNKEAFKKFISSSKNGFMLETILYEDYHPGNPSYYEKPTRRNGKYIYNGSISDPVMGAEVLAAFDTEKGSFKLMIAKDKKIKTIYDYNVYIIYKGLVCGIERFTDPVGDGLALYKVQKLETHYTDLPALAFQYKTSSASTEEPLSFKDNTFYINESKLQTDVLQLKEKDKSRTKNKITLNLTVPIAETDLDTNNSTQKIIDNLYKKIQKIYPETPISIIKKENFLAFKEHYKSQKKDPKSYWSIDEWKNRLTDPTIAKEHKFLLDKSWSGNLVFTQYQDSVSELATAYSHQLQTLDTSKTIKTEDIVLATQLQSLLFSQSKNVAIPLPNKLLYNASLNAICTNHLIYNYNSIIDPSEDTLKYFYKVFLENNVSPNATLKDKINFLKFSCNEMNNQPFDFNYRSNVLAAELKKLNGKIKEEEYKNLSDAYEVKLTNYYSHYPKAQELFESNLNSLFEKYSNSNEEYKYKLALTMAYFGKMDKVNQILEPYLVADSKALDMIALYNKINQVYLDFFGNTSNEYMNTLIRSIDNLGTEKWCAQFVGKGNISFQIFDYLPLYKQYCQECAQYNNAAKKVSY